MSNYPTEKVKTQVKKVPSKPGIYKYFNEFDEIIYIGKAKNLKNRVRSYFSISLDPASKTARLVEDIRRLEYIETLSEFEAIILEAELIKKHQPKYNIALKDDKSYLYIVIRKELLNVKGKEVKLPRILTARHQDINEDDEVFGPYTEANIAKFLVRSLRKPFPFRDCTTSKYKKYQKIGSPCLYGHIGLCPAPCTGKTTLKEYNSEIQKIRNILKGKTSKIINSLERSMNLASKKQHYEEAAKFRDTIKKFNYIRAHTSRVSKYIDNPYLVSDLREKSLRELRVHIPILLDEPNRIECYDISNISGTDAVGSMVVAIDGDIAKSEYKRFKIKTKNTPDDFYMMKEVLYRRLKRQEWEYPDLLVVDGGKGQVSAALEVADKLSVDIPIVGIAKKLELIVYRANGQFHELELPKDNEGLKLIQRLRDESHRFAQSYHHKLRLNRVKND